MVIRLKELFFPSPADLVSLYHSVDSSLPLSCAAAGNDTVCNHWPKLNKTKTLRQHTARPFGPEFSTGLS